MVEKGSMDEQRAQSSTENEAGSGDYLNRATKRIARAGTQDADVRVEATGVDRARELSAEYRRWKERAIIDSKACRAQRPFESTLIPGDERRYIELALSNCDNVEDVAQRLCACSREGHKPKSTSRLKQWRQPGPEQERLEAQMVATLRELFAKSKTPSHDDKESAAQTLASIIEQAYTIAHAHVFSETQERAIAWGGSFQNALTSAWNIVNHYVNRIAQWFLLLDSAGTKPTQEAIQGKIESLAEQVGSVEVHAAVEEEVLRGLTFAGVKMVKSIAQPGACDDCLAKAAAPPVPIDQFVPPPYHGYCRCSSSPADEE